MEEVEDEFACDFDVINEGVWLSVEDKEDMMEGVVCGPGSREGTERGMGFM